MPLIAIEEIEKLYILLGVQLCFRCFFPKFEALFLKRDYLFMIQSTVLC